MPFISCVCHPKDQMCNKFYIELFNLNNNIHYMSRTAPNPSMIIDEHDMQKKVTDNKIYYNKISISTQTYSGPLGSRLTIYKNLITQKKDC